MILRPIRQALGGTATADQKVEVEATTGSAIVNGAVESVNGEVEVTAKDAVTTNAALNAKTNVKVTSQANRAVLGWNGCNVTEQVRFRNCE